MALAMIACAKGTDSVDLGEGGVDEAAARDVFVIPDDASKPDTATPGDGGKDAPVDSPATGTHVVINEIQTAGSGELVELFNPTSSTVSLMSWEVRYASSGGNAGSAGHKFTSGTTSIPAGGYVALTGSTWTPGMAAGDGQLGLFDGPTAGAKLVDGVAYGSVSGGTLHYGEKQTAPSPPSGGSIGRSASGADTDDNKADFKTFATTSPGAANP